MNNIMCASTRAARLLAVLLTVAALTVVGGFNAMDAKADTVWTDGGGSTPPQGQFAGPTIYNLRASYTWGSDWVNAGAHVPGSWTMYGSYILGWNYACHTYAAGNNLGGMHQNASIYIWQYLDGRSNDFLAVC